MADDNLCTNIPPNCYFWLCTANESNQLEQLLQEFSISESLSFLHDKNKIFSQVHFFLEQEMALRERALRSSAPFADNLTNSPEWSRAVQQHLVVRFPTTLYNSNYCGAECERLCWEALLIYLNLVSLCKILPRTSLKTIIILHNIFRQQTFLYTTCNCPDDTYCKWHRWLLKTIECILQELPYQWLLEVQLISNDEDIK